MSDEITINLLLDGFRYDYIKHTSFLKNLSKEAFVARTQEPFGFESIRPAIFAGVYPETSNVSHIFWHSPTTSKLGGYPIKWLQETRFFLNPWLSNKYANLLFEAVFKVPLKLTLRTPMSSGASSNGNITERIISYIDFRKGNASLYQIPPELLSYFDFAEKNLCYTKGYIGENPTIFDILEAKNKRWIYNGYPTFVVSIDNNHAKNNLKKIIGKETDFIHIHIYNADSIGHQYGPESSEIRETIGKIDDFVKEIYQILTSKYTKVNFFVYGDHGMVPITNTIDILKFLDTSNLKIGKDYVVFLDSPMARFWFKNKNAKNKILEILSQLDCGRVLTEKDYEKHRIRFRHNKYGELIWLANPGTLVFPNFFQRTKPAKGMHGYDPECMENQGLFMLVTDENIEIKTKEIVPLVDIFPTTLDLLNLPTPKNCEGKSIIKGD